MIRRVFSDGTRLHAVLLTVAAVLALGAVGGIAYLALDEYPDWDTGLLEILCAGGAAGLVLGVRHNWLPDIAGGGAGAVRRTNRQSRRTALDLLLVTLLVVVVGLPFGAAYAAREDDSSGWFMSALFGLIVGAGALGGWLVDVFVVLPIASIVSAFVGPRTGSRVAAAGGALFITIGAFAASVILAAPDAYDGERGRLRQFVTGLGVLLGWPGVVVEHAAMLWAARLSALALVASIVWTVREARRATDRRTGTASMLDRRLGGRAEPDAD